jgi:hypothetical protein
MTFDEKGKVVKSVQPIKTPVRTLITVKMRVIFISDSRLCGVERMRLGSSSSVVNKINYSRIQNWSG